jgi:hypothetical protein
MVKFGVYERRERPHSKVTVTHSGVYFNRRGANESEQAVIYHTFNEPEYNTQVMTSRDFLATHRYVGKMMRIHSVEERLL